MSQRIAELERAAGVPLVRRTTRSVRLTEAGQRLVDDTRAPFERIAHSFAGVRDLAGAPRGLLRVTAPVALRAPADGAAAGRISCAPIRRCASNWTVGSPALAGDGRLRPGRAARRRAARHARRVAAVRPRARCWSRVAPTCAAAALPELPQDLANHDCLHYPRTQDAPAWSFEPRRRRASERARCRSTGRSPPTTARRCAMAAAIGLGIALLPDFSAQAAIAGGQAGGGAAAMAAGGRLRRTPVCDPSLLGPRAARGGGLRRVLAGSVRGRLRRLNSRVP